MVAPNDMLGGYRLIDLLGAGGMGEVWRAEDTRLGRHVAIKILPQSVAADTEAIARMRREARTAAQLNHPNIATIHSFEEAEGRTFIVMELVEGEPLTNMIRRGRLAEAEVCRIGAGVAEALAEAHEKGVVHRDIKPDNIIVRGQRVKVLDFGIAKRISIDSAIAADASAFVTQQGMILGTVHYMSPEQALGKPVDPRSDLFSLGVVLYEASTGQLPFQGETVTETITRIIRDDPQPARRINPSISAGLNAIIERCLRKNRDERFATADDLAIALTTQATSAPTQAITNATTAPLAASDAVTVRTAARPERPPSPATVRTASRGPAPSAPKTRSVLFGSLAILAGLIVAAIFALPMLRSRSATGAEPRPANAQTTATAAPITTSHPAGTVVTTSAARAQTAVNVTAAPVAPAPSIPSSSPSSTAGDAQDATLTAGHLTSESIASDRKPIDALAGSDAYARGMRELAAGNRKEAHAAFESAIQADPHHARAEFRLGEMALLNRNFGNATEHFNNALANADRLDPRERRLSDLGLAIVHGNRIEAIEIARQIREEYPFDRDLEAIHRAYPFMSAATTNERFRRRRFQR